MNTSSVEILIANAMQNQNENGSLMALQIERNTKPTTQSKSLLGSLLKVWETFLLKRDTTMRTPPR